MLLKATRSGCLVFNAEGLVSRSTAAALSELLCMGAQHAPLIVSPPCFVSADFTKGTVENRSRCVQTGHATKVFMKAEKEQ